MTTVTRTDLADLLDGAFGPGGADRSSLLEAAEGNGAPPEALDVLGQLPPRRFRGLRDLWEHLPEVPVG